MPTKSELDKLQGTWNVASLEVDSRNMPAGSAQIVIRGDRFQSLLEIVSVAQELLAYPKRSS